MASYFDLPPQSKTTTAEAAGLPEHARHMPDDFGFGRQSGLLSPQVARILDNLDFEEQSDSDNDSSHSGDSDPPGPTTAGASHTENKDRNSDTSPKLDPSTDAANTAKTSRTTSTPPISASTSKKPHPLSQSSPLSQSKHIKLPPPSPSLGVGASRQKHPHLARFHSLRSMLFSSQIEDDMSKAEEARKKSEGEEKWKAEHENRKALNRPKTPESPSGSIGGVSPTKGQKGQSKEGGGIAHRLGNKLKRMTTKDVPVMDKIKEDRDVENESTASDDEDDSGVGKGKQPRFIGRDADEESIRHSDVDDLVRWVSRRDPPSDGEARKVKTAEKMPESSGNDSMGQSDVEDIVKWVRRGSASKQEEKEVRASPSDASTESDEGSRRESIGEQDVDELMRWVSHKDGPKAGPIRDTKKTAVSSNDSDTSELATWIKREDETSGESDALADLTTLSTPAAHQAAKSSPRDVVPDDRPRGRSPRRKESVAEALSNDDVDELVHWVSNKPTPTKTTTREEPTTANTAQKTEQKDEEQQHYQQQQLVMHHPDTSLAPEHIDELARFAAAPPSSRGQHDSSPNHHQHHQQQIEDEQNNIVLPAVQEQQDQTQKKKEIVGMELDEGSLGPGDVDDLVRFAAGKKEGGE